MSDWKKRSIKRRDFRHTKTDDISRHKKKAVKNKRYKLIFIYKVGDKIISYSKKYRKIKNLKEALRTERNKKSILKLIGYKIKYNNVIIEEKYF